MTEENICIRVLNLHTEFNRAYSLVKVLYNAVTSEAPSLNDLELEHQIDIIKEYFENFKEHFEEFTDDIEYEIQELNKKKS